MSKRLMFCGHVIKYLGNGRRTTTRRFHSAEDPRDKVQDIIHIYTEFARYVDLEKIVDAHIARSQ
jgi:hypothetical protein